MCTISKRNPVLQVAEEDIVVYKQVHIIYEERSLLRKLLNLKRKVEHFKAIVYDFKYIPGKIYETELEPFKKGSSLWNRAPRFYSGSGFYSCKDRHSYTNVKCIIPKGAKYYLAEDYNMYEMVYVSDKIKIVSPL